MPAPLAPMSEAQVAERRRNVRRTALIFAALAVAIYVGFVLSGVLAR